MKDNFKSFNKQDYQHGRFKKMYGFSNHKKTNSLPKKKISNIWISLTPKNLLA